MRCYIAIDSGGTKTDAVLFDESGQVLWRELSKGCNPNDIGLPAAQAQLVETIRRVSGHAPNGITGVYAGVAGSVFFHEEMDQYVREHICTQHWRLENDGGNMITGELGLQDGCCLICGTGSVLIIRKSGQPWVCLGGRGYLIDTDGSGFRLGQELLKAAFRDRDGRTAKTVIPELIEQKSGEALENVVTRVYAEGRPYIASFAQLVFEGAQKGDWACKKIMDEGAVHVADLTWAAAKHFEGRFPVVMGGGILTAYPEYAELVREKACPKAELIGATAPPVYGSAVEAMADSGLACNELFKQRFLQTYRSVENCDAGRFCV